jgi:hypothetical protein
MQLTDNLFNMKHQIISFISVIFFLLISGTSVYSQRFTGGLAIGLSASQVDGDTYSGYHKAGITSGGWVNVAFNDKFAFQAGLNYIQKGSVHNPKPDDLDQIILKIKLGYAEMPLLLQYKMKSGLFIEAGPSIGVLLHSKYEYDLLESPVNNYRVLDFGFQVGAGYRFNEKMKVGIRSGNSQYSITKGEGPGFIRRFGSYGQYNNVLVLELSYVL